jgi:tRNA pseudouridine38-40 synthase
MPTVRLRIDLAYDGGDFHGWAAQPGLRTVQGDLEAALATVLRVGAVSVVCAGRTDTGVHARGQVVHLDVEPDALAAVAVRYDGDPCDALARRLDGLLPADLRVRREVTAPAGFDARFSPLWRRYVYRVTDGVPDPLTRGHVLAWPRPVDIDAVNEASAGLLGLHDFAAFCKQREGATTVRTLLGLAWTRDDDLVTGTVRADAFCHHMVRSLVGCLLTVGEGRRPVAWAGEVLAAGVRDPAVTVVPPHGLTLEEVGYPPDADLAVRAGQTRTRRTT